MNHTISIDEAPPCEVSYFSEADQAYVKLKKDDFDKILRERRGAFFVSKLLAALTLVSIFVLSALSGLFYSENQVGKAIIVYPISK